MFICDLLSQSQGVNLPLPHDLQTQTSKAEIISIKTLHSFALLRAADFLLADGLGLYSLLLLPCRKKSGDTGNCSLTKQKMISNSSL